MGQENSKKRILIVDDHAFVRRGLCDFIGRESDFVVCGEAAGRAEALQLCAATHPHLALIDLSLGADSGLDLIKEIGAQFPEIKMLVLSMHDEMLYAEMVLRVVAAGYVSKSAPPDRLIEAIRCVLDGGDYASESVKQKIMKTLQKVAAGGDPVDRLSDRELAVFEQIGKGRSTAEIAASMQRGVKTIDTYRARIKAKLGIHGSTELVQRAVQWILDQKG